MKLHKVFLLEFIESLLGILSETMRKYFEPISASLHIYFFPIIKILNWWNTIVQVCLWHEEGVIKADVEPNLELYCFCYFITYLQVKHSGQQFRLLVCRYYVVDFWQWIGKYQYCNMYKSISSLLQRNNFLSLFQNSLVFMFNCVLQSYFL